MKKSYYNYIIPDKDKIFCFNGISKYFFSIPQKNEKALNSILDHPEDYENKLPHFYEKLVEGGFIINEEVDELTIIRAKHQAACNSKHYFITILPTLDCNFRCWYCYENHTPYKMSEATIEKVKKYILHILEHENPESLNIEWFGGEPFLCFSEVIKPISVYAKEKCRERNVPFTTSATSNGYLIVEPIAKELASLNFNRIQITIDGEKSAHDKTRVASNDSSFEKILSNMNRLCEMNPEVKVTIRINYDEKNFQPSLIFSQIKEQIDEKNLDRFAFILRKVWQVEKVESGREKALEFIRLIKDSKFKYYSEADFICNFIPCYACAKNMKLITPYGSIGKCTTKDDFEKQALGHLTEEGLIEWNNEMSFDEIYATPLFENQRCLGCKQLPLCMGVCPKNIDTNGIIGASEKCKGQVNNMNITDAILNYCKTNEVQSSI